MNSQDHTNTQHSPGGKSAHVCSKCGWNYPNPHPSAKNRRAHKKICGTIKGFEILGSEQNLDLQKEQHCLDDEPKTPSPRVVEKVGDTSEEDVFADAVCEFSSSLVSDSIKEKDETTANGIAKSATDLGETQRCNKSSEVVQESCEVPAVEVLDNFSSSVEGATVNRDGGAHSMESESLIETSREAKLASALGKRKDLSWNDEVDVEGPHGFVFEEMSRPVEADYTVSENVPVDTCNVKANAAQVISTIPSVPVAENVDISLHETKGLEDQTCLVAVSVENKVTSKIDCEDIKVNDAECVSSLGSAQEPLESKTSRASLPAVDPIVAVSNADVSYAANKIGVADLIVHARELVQANVVAQESKTISELSSESSSDVEHYASPLSVVLEGDSPSDQNQSLTETSKDTILQVGAEACESNDNRVVGGLGVIQTNEIDGNVKAHDIYAEVPVTIESNDHRDFGRLQNLSEAHIRSLVLSPLVTRDNTSNEGTGRSDGVNKPENEPQLDVALWKNQEITMEKTTSWSTEHVPLKNLLNEARSPRLVGAEAASNIQRVSSILTSPEEERREVSEEWNTPAKYPVERKVKGRPFWVPFVCCSSAAK